jgi:putative DNA primase/helicase
MLSKNLQEVSKENPCQHCGKQSWCYRLGENLSVCKRNAEPAKGWYQTRKTDREGNFFYAPVTEQKSKSPHFSQKKLWEYPSRDAQPLVRVVRINPQKIIWQEYWLPQVQELAKFSKDLGWVKLSAKDLAQGNCSQAQFDLFQELRDQLRSQIPIYRYGEVKEAIARGERILIAEGEPCVDKLWELGIPATTNIGGAKKWKRSDSEDLKGAKVVLCPDRDVPGMTHCQKIAQDFPYAEWLYPYPDSPLWKQLPPSHGLDVANWIADYDLTKEDILQAIETKPRAVTSENSSSLIPHPSSLENPSSLDSEIELHYTQKCVEDLYSDTRWISLEGKLYYWTGQYYQQAKEGQERKRISDWCYCNPVKTKSGWKYAYATATHVDNIWRWLHSYFSYPIEDVNPSGINCLNGIVKIEWEGRKARWELMSHDPNLIYTYLSEINFEPNADSSHCERMLSCLEEPQQKLFLQTIAAALDLNKIRSFRGREVKALICKGHGNNGKDTLREAIRMLFGQSMTNATVSDFVSYDNGRKFSLAKLESAKINWSSENCSFNNLDRLQSLKAAITGEPLDMERKGVDEHEMMLDCVFLFNINEAPDLKAGIEAIQSRWAVLSFEKTYKLNADFNKGEIEADSRFRYDPEFLKTEVCPALLNKILEALAILAIEGIDYSCTEEALKEIQEETNHLWSFVREVGLEESPEGKVYINDLWELLFKWYVNNGTLEIQWSNGREKKIWHEQVRKNDQNIKSQNQIYQRFRELFPKIKKARHDSLTEDVERIGEFYLIGIKLNDEVGKINDEQSLSHHSSSFLVHHSSLLKKGDFVTLSSDKPKEQIGTIIGYKEDLLVVQWGASQFPEKYFPTQLKIFQTQENTVSPNSE